MTPKLSILISSKDRLKLFKRALYSIDAHPPDCPFEVVVADEGSTEDVVGELRKRSFPWVFVRCEMAEFERLTGLKKFWNCPAWTNNVAFQHSQGAMVAQMGNEIIVRPHTFTDLLGGLAVKQFAWSCSQTYDVPLSIVERLDEYGKNLSAEDVRECLRWRLDNDNNVPNYLSVFTRECWTATGGYDERYVSGIGAEDSDFIRRVMSLPGFTQRKERGVSLHQYHGGVNHFYRPLPEVISEERLAEGVAINRRIYNNWDGTIHNRQAWPMGTLGVREVIRS